MTKYRKYESMSGKGWRVDKTSEDGKLLEKKYFSTKRKASGYIKKKTALRHK